MVASRDCFNCSGGDRPERLRSRFSSILDGFDLGVGIPFGTTNEETKRVQMMNAIAPFWDGNETWLVIIGANLFAAFPVVYCSVPQRILPVRCCCSA
jgi:cytochrome bd-type quinol oxidase subunit 2